MQNRLDKKIRRFNDVVVHRPAYFSAVDSAVKNNHISSSKGLELKRDYNNFLKNKDGGQFLLRSEDEIKGLLEGMKMYSDAITDDMQRFGYENFMSALSWVLNGGIK